VREREWGTLESHTQTLNLQQEVALMKHRRQSQRFMSIALKIIQFYVYPSKEKVRGHI
jgi:hypothetical protein